MNAATKAADYGCMTEIIRDVLSSQRWRGISEGGVLKIVGVRRALKPTAESNRLEGQL